MKNLFRKTSKFLSFVGVVAGVIALASLPFTRNAKADITSSPSAYTAPRLTYLALTNGATANAVGTNNGWSCTLTAGQSTNISGPGFALFKGRGFAHLPQVITTTTGTTNTVVFLFNLGYTNTLSGTSAFSTIAPITNTMTANASGTLTGYFNNPASSFDNVNQAQLVTIVNNSPNTIVITNDVVSQFP